MNAGGDIAADNEKYHMRESLQSMDAVDPPLAPTTEQLRLFVGTWNVGGRAPTPETRQSLQEWLTDSSGDRHHDLQQLPEVYVIGFQEIVSLDIRNVLKGGRDGGNSGELSTCEIWESLISETLNEHSVLRSNGYSAMQHKLNTLGADNGNNIVPDISSHDGPNSFSCVPQHAQKDINNHPSLFSLDENVASAWTPISRVQSQHKSKSKLSKAKETPSVGMYTRIARKQMVGLFITVWVQGILHHRITNVQVTSVGCGIMNRLGNKGSVSISLSIYETSFCFICSHVRSGEGIDNATRRNVDVEKILHQTKFPRIKITSHNNGIQPTKSVLAHDRIILLGDLNYRLSIGPTKLEALLLQQDWSTLLENDELKVAKGLGGVLEGWREGSIYFAPTYKYMLNSDTYYWMEKQNDNPSKRRAPAWCDRILWHGKGIKQLSYTRCESTHSDHRPVRSIFVAEVEVLDKTSILDYACDPRVTPLMEEVKELIYTRKLNVHRFSLR